MDAHLDPSSPTSPEKEKAEQADIQVLNATTTSAKQNDYDFDAFDFGGDSTLPPPPVLTQEQENKLYRKIDLRLMPMLVIMYLFSFLDRGNIGNAKLDGLVTQLDLTGNRYNIALTMYFIPYCLCECPSNLVLKKFRPSRWLPGITVVWGIIMTLMGLVKTYPQLVGVRICLGVAEAGLFPGIVYYLTLWYPRHLLQFRVGNVFGAASLAGAFSGLLAFGISFMGRGLGSEDGGVGGLEAWSWIFILEGLATVTVGIVAFFVIVDFPVSAQFLTPEERAYVIWKKKYDNSKVGEEERFRMSYLWEALSDWQVWAHIVVYVSIVGPLYGISLFLPSIIETFGHSTAITQLLTVPPYIFATITLYAFAIASDRLRLRSPFIYLGLIMLLIGLSINIAPSPSSGVKYFGTFFVVAGAYASFPGVVCWLGNNLSGQYKRAVGMAIHIGVGNFSGAISSNVFRTQDAPRYILGFGILLMWVGLGIIAVPIVVLVYTRINKNRERKMQELGLFTTGSLNDSEREGPRIEKLRELTEEEVRERRRIGDRAVDFKYML